MIRIVYTTIPGNAILLRRSAGKSELPQGIYFIEKSTPKGASDRRKTSIYKSTVIARPQAVAIRSPKPDGFGRTTTKMATFWSTDCHVGLRLLAMTALFRHAEAPRRVLSLSNSNPNRSRHQTRARRKRVAAEKSEQAIQSLLRRGAVKQSKSEPSLPSGNARYATEFVTHCLQMLSGAADRTRTGTELPPADFKSAVSTIPPQRRGLPNYFSIVCGGSQGIPVGRMACLRRPGWITGDEGWFLPGKSYHVIAKPEGLWQ